MLKYLSSAVTFAEFPDEIALCLNITGCPCFCDNCSEPELRPDVGTELTEEVLEELIKNNPGISLVGLMGGDRDHKDIVRIANYIHSKGLKIGMYSGMNSLDMDLLNCLDCYKIGRWIMPKGKMEDWHKTSCGPLIFPWSNQRYFEKHDNLWFDETEKFRKQPLNNLERYIL